MRPKVKTYSDPIPEMLTEYIGEYISEELSTKYSILVDNDELKIKHHRLGAHELSYAWKDDFRGSLWFMNSVEFYRNPRDSVIGFNVSSFRVRNQQFKKQE